MIRMFLMQFGRFSERGIIFSHKQGVMKTVGINTELSAWILDKQQKTGKVFPKTGISFPKSGKTFPETVDTQDYNNNNIKRSSSENSDESDDRLSKFLSAHPDAVIYTPNFTKWGTAADQQCAEWLVVLVEKVKPFPKKPIMASWANDVRLMRELDGHSHREICSTVPVGQQGRFLAYEHPLSGKAACQMGHAKPPA